MTTRVYGCKKDKIKFGSIRSSKAVSSNITLIDLRPKCPPIYDQGNLGSCTANALGGCYHFCELKQNNPIIIQPSRLFIYYNERNMENSVNQDSGASLSDGILSISKLGVCSETLWTYDIKKFKIKPTQQCYTQALDNQSITYQQVNQTRNDIKQTLIDGYPIAVGILVYDSFESNEVSKSGIVPMPSSTENLLGGHAVMIVGFDESLQVYIMRNSWGINWGMKGYFTIPYAYIESPLLAFDFWVIEKVEAPKPPPKPTPPPKPKPNQNPMPPKLNQNQNNMLNQNPIPPKLNKNKMYYPTMYPNVYYTINYTSTGYYVNYIYY